MSFDFSGELFDLAWEIAENIRKVSEGEMTEADAKADEKQKMLDMEERRKKAVPDMIRNSIQQKLKDEQQQALDRGLNVQPASDSGWNMVRGVKDKFQNLTQMVEEAGFTWNNDYSNYDSMYYLCAECPEYGDKFVMVSFLEEPPFDWGIQIFTKPDQTQKRVSYDELKQNYSYVDSASGYNPMKCIDSRDNLRIVSELLLLKKML